VDFEFEVDRDRFQVIRKRTRGKASGALDFYQLTPEGDRMPVTGGTMTETQAEITRRVRMDYDTFLNSAFIAQGRSNEFTRKPPADRKDVFGKILGLERYERLAAAATDRRKAAQFELKSSEDRTLQAQAEVACIPQAEEALATARGELERLNPKVAAKEQEVAGLRAVEAWYRRLEEALAAATERERRACERLEGVRERAARLGDARAKAEAVRADGAEIRSRHERLTELRAAEHALAEAQAQARSLERERDEALAAVQAEQARLESRLESARREAEECERKASGLAEAEARASSLATEREAVADLRERVKEARETESELRSNAARDRARAESYRSQASEIKEKEAQLDGAAMCPICQKPLGPGEADHVKAEYAAQRKALGEQWKAANAAADEAERDAEALRTTANGGEREADERERKLRAAEQTLHAEVSAAKEAAAGLPALQTKVNDLGRVLADGAFAKEAREAAEVAAGAIAGLGYDASRHAAVRAEIQELRDVEAAFQALGRAETEADMLRTQITAGEAECAEASRELDTCTEEVRRAQQELAGADDVSGQLSGLETELAGLKEMASELARNQGKLESTLDHLRATQARVEEAIEREQALKDEIATFEQLGVAFGKNGVQAMLIDQSLPRVEQLANDMLVRMTGGRIQVRLETQRANARGGAVETLDILISDEMGTRGYEMYSGGEAFRVDFALRIALARLLAERSGASLPTLIIDEGFGTQDSEGIGRLVETLNVVKDDFRLILVVTHLEELKGMFERRIEVTKDLVQGSYARVV